MMLLVRLKFLFLFVCCSSLKVVAQSPEVQFVLVKEDSPIFVHERWITFPGKVPAVKAREVKGEFMIRASMYTVLDILKDESKIKIWQKHVTDFKVYPQPDTTWWLEYSYHDIPWPVSDQDHFLKYVLKEQIPGKQLFITFQSEVNDKLAPVQKGVTRMELAGSWTLEQVNNQHVKVTYRILSMPSHIPRMFTDPVIRSNLMSTIKALTKLAEAQR
ncbi:MAG: hypothetical protein KF763_14955 [Cyclobacteriaceae bacterium]|nr:hypothetical protein [Cyclobacteriaceae bacterium]